MKIVHTFYLICLLNTVLLLNKSDGGLLYGAVTAGTCCGVCGTGLAICAGAASAIPAALVPNPLTFAFASTLTPWFTNGCWAGFGACYATCVSGALIGSNKIKDA